MKKLLIMPALAAVLLAGPTSSNTFAAGGPLDQSIDALFNLRDQLQDVVMKSVKGVGEAMQEGPPRDDSKPWTLEDLEQLRKKNANIEKLNSDLAAKQQQLLNVNAAILKKLPPNDPRRAAVAAKIREIGGQIPATRAAAKEYAGKLAETNAAIDRWKAAHALPTIPTTQPGSSPAAGAVDDEVIVPNLAAFESATEMKAALAHAGLSGTLVAASEKPSSKAKEFKFAGQAPAPDTKVKRGSSVAISFYQAFEPDDDEVTVPNLAVFESASEMKATLAHAGLTGQLVAASEKPPSKSKEFKFAGQAPAPDTKVKRGSSVAISFYQAFEATSAGAEAGDFVGIWSGTLLGENVKIEIQKQGEGYVMLSKQVALTKTGVKPNKPKSHVAFMKDGKLVSEGDYIMEGGEVTGTTSAGGGPKKEFTTYIETKKLGTTTTILERKGDTLVGTMIFRNNDGQTGEMPLLFHRQ